MAIPSITKPMIDVTNPAIAWPLLVVLFNPIMEKINPGILYKSPAP